MNLQELTPAHYDGCEAIIVSLPEWFGYPGALEGVANALNSQAGVVALDQEQVVGFVTLSPTFDETLEITYLAVLRDHRRRGIGRQLLGGTQRAAGVARASNLCLLTLGPSGNSQFYEETVAFYRAVGFARLKEMGLVAWNGGPALLMAIPVDDLEILESGRQSR